ncbi:MAG: hypothetical protein AAF572_08350 [Cyanobacteria bacterium P01_B01_bin.77]
MATPSNYWNMTVLTAAGQLSPREHPEAQQLFRRLFAKAMAAGDISDRDCQSRLWQVWKTEAKDSAIAQLCLRCWLSHHIVITCRQLAQSFGDTYGFRATDLWPRVLDDTGNITPAQPSLALTILTSYSPDRASLGVWAKRLTQSHRDLTKFLLSQGLYRATPWAILNDTQVSQLSRFLPHLSASMLATEGKLLNAYHQVYRQDRIKQRVGRGQRCLPPTDEQLQRIDPNQPVNVVRSRLHDLAERLRESRVARRGGPLPTRSIDSQDYLEPVAPEPDETEDRQVRFMESYHQDFRATLGEAIQVTVTAYTERYQARKTPKGESYRKALELFHCEGYSMKEIATIVGLNNQVAVTRLLNLNQFRAEVCIYWLRQLKERVNDQALEHLSADQLDAIAQRLEQILQEETESIMSDAASEARIPVNRTAKSVFARQLCEVVPTMPLPPA